jgi:hypothetical protein
MEHGDVAFSRIDSQETRRWMFATPLVDLWSVYPAMRPKAESPGFLVEIVVVQGVSPSLQGACTVEGSTFNTIMAPI